MESVGKLRGRGCGRVVIAVAVDPFSSSGFVMEDAVSIDFE